MATIKGWMGLAGLAAAILVALPASVHAEQAVVERNSDLRDGAGFGRTIIRRLSEGETVEVLGEKVGWIQVRSRWGDGWIRSHALARPAKGELVDVSVKPLEPTVPVPIQTLAPAAHPLAVVHEPPELPTVGLVSHPEPGDPFGFLPRVNTASADALALRDRVLYVRAAPSWETGLTGHVGRDLPVEIMQRDGEWSEIRSGQILGWVRTEALGTNDTWASLASPGASASGSQVASLR